MADIPRIPFSDEAPQQPVNPLSADEIRNRLNTINNFLDANRANVLDGITQAQADRYNSIDRVKRYLPTGTPSTPAIQNLVSGDAFTGPNPGLRPNNLPTLDYVNALMEKSKMQGAQSYDIREYAAPTSFDASRIGYNFDRYYSHPDFKKLGFNITRDNEGLYNANASWLDDFRRMGSKWIGLAWNGGVGNLKNWGRFGDDSNPNEAAQMEHDLAVAMSSKGGAGSWVTNFLGNSAYTLGIVGEMIVEEAAAALLTIPTGGGSQAIQQGRRGMNLKRFGTSLSKMVDSFKDINKARDYWSDAGVKALEFVNPLRGTTTMTKQLLDPSSAINRLDNFKKIKHSFGAFYRDAREINAVTSESRLEGAFVQNKVANESIKAFYDKNGRMPNEQEAEEISRRSYAAGVATTMANIPAIFFSNRVVLDTALKGFQPVRRLMNKEALKSRYYKLKHNADWKAQGKTPFEVVSKSTLGAMKAPFSVAYWKSIPSKVTGKYAKRGFENLAGNSLRYFNANLMEGLQEVYQEAAQTAISDYYLQNYFANLYQDPHLAAKNTISASILKGVDEMFSAQGLDVFAQGFLMGGVLQPIQNSVISKAHAAQMKIGDYVKKTNSYEEYHKAEKERIQKYADAINSVMSDPTKYAAWLDENVARQRDLQEEMEVAEATGDKYEEENAKDESLFMHVYTLLQTGKFDPFIDQLEDLRQLSDEELDSAFNSRGADLTQTTSRNRLERAIKKANEIKNRYENINSKLENPYNPDYFDPKTNPEGYMMEQLGYQSFEIAKRAAAFSEYSFDRALQRMSSLVSKASVNGPLGAVAAMDFAALYKFGNDFKAYENMLISEIQALSNSDSSADKSLAKKKQTTLNNLRDLRNVIAQYRNALKLIDRAKTSTEALNELKDLALKTLKENKKDIVIDDIVDPDTGQLSINFDAVAEDLTVNQPDVVVEEYLKELIYDLYARYTKNLAGLNNVFPISDSIENSFADLIDYIKLDADARSLSNQIEILANPMSVYDMSNRIARAKKVADEQRLKLLEKALITYKEKIADVDGLMNKLLGIGVFFDPKYIDTFLKTGKLPPVFLDAATKQAILPGSEKYNQIIDLIEEEEKLRGVTFDGKPVRPKPKTPPSGPTAPPTGPETPPAGTPPTGGPGVPPSAPPAPGGEALEEKPPVEAKDVTVNTLFSELPPDLQEDLKNAHVEAMIDGASSDIQVWMKEDPTAALIISGKKKAVTPAAKKTTPTPVKREIITEEAGNSTVIPDSDPAVREITKKSLERKWRLSNDQKTYVASDGSGDVAKRVSDLKPKDGDEEDIDEKYSTRGNIFDSLIRQFFLPGLGVNRLSAADAVINEIRSQEDKVDAQNIIKGALEASWEILSTKPEFAGIEISEAVFENLAAGLYEFINKFQDFKFSATLPTMAGTFNNEAYAGTIDLLIEKDGYYHIIDIKTSAKSRRLEPDLYELGDQIQQNAYAELFFQNTGIEITSINILNIVVDMSSNGKKISNATFDTYTDANGKLKMLTPITKKSIAELKGFAQEEVKTGSVSDIETEKQKITPAETKEKLKAPARFNGTIIYAFPGTVSPTVFENYDVVDADDIVKEVMIQQGMNKTSDGTEIPNFDKSFTKILFDAPAAIRDSVQEIIIDKLKSLANSGKTVVTSNWFMKDHSTVQSFPDISQAKFLKSAANEKESVEQSKLRLGKFEARKEEYEMSQKKDWEAVDYFNGRSIETKTNKTVEQLLKSGDTVMSKLDQIVKMSPQNTTLDSLGNIVAVYLSDPETAQKYYTVNENNQKRILSEEEFLDAIREKAKSALSKDEMTQLEEGIKFLKEKFQGKVEDTKKVEGSEEGQAAIDKAKEDGPSNAAQDLDGIKDASKDAIDDDFKDNLGC